jgi:hypothetical protein
MRTKRGKKHVGKPVRFPRRQETRGRLGHFGCPPWLALTELFPMVNILYKAIEARRTVIVLVTQIPSNSHSDDGLPTTTLVVIAIGFTWKRTRGWRMVG